MRRRSGPTGEERWWAVEDQRFVESLPSAIGDLGRGWRRDPMLNNVETIDPHGPGAAADRLRMVRDERVLTALDEGAAWRRPATGALLVLRAEMFAGAHHEHRAAWRELGTTVLESTWRHRWRERDRTPGWIEARWLDGEIDGGSGSANVDRIHIEDHTGGEDVVVYRHVTIWAGPLHAILTLRSPLGEPVDPALAAATAAVERAGFSRRSDPGSGCV